MITRILLLISFCLITYSASTQHANAEKNKSAIDEKAVLFAKSWNLVELFGTSTTQPGMQHAYITFQEDAFNYTRLTGFTGCNFIGGKIDLLAGDDITFHPDLITNNNCSGSTVESPFLQALVQADSWAEKNGQLLLERKGKVIARLNPSTFTDPNLPGAWQLVYVCDLAVPFSQVFPALHCPNMTFTKNQNTVTGSAGCHEFTSTFASNSGSIVFRDATACDTNCVVTNENVFLDRLHTVNAYVFKDDKTLVFIDDNKPVMAFTRMKPIQASPATASRD